MSRLTVRDGRIVSSATGTTFIWVSGTILAGLFDVVITHNLGTVPLGYLFTALDDYAALGGLKVTALTNATITVSLVNAQAANATFKVGVAA